LHLAPGRSAQDERSPSVIAGLAPVNHVVVVHFISGVDVLGTPGHDIRSPGAGS